MKRILAVLLVLSVLAVGYPAVSAFADTPDYTTYVESNKEGDRDVPDVMSDLSAAVAADGAVTEYTESFEGKSNVLKWTNGEGSVTFTFAVPKTGLYNLALGYYMLDTDTEAAEFNIKVDGEDPFSGLTDIALTRLFADAGEIRTDGMGNEFAPEQKEVFAWQEKRVTDPEGLNSKPYLFYMTEGEHTVTLSGSDAPFALCTVKLCAEEDPIPYAELLKKYEQEGYTNYSGEQIVYQGEKADLKSANSLISMSDGTTAKVTPHDPIVSKLNYIGGGNWSGPGDTITWNIEVPASGLYKLSFGYQQSYIMNGSAYRVIRIDGEIPFEEASLVKFDYTNAWKNMTVSYKEGKKEIPYLFYLEEGPHTLSLEVNLGELSSFAIGLKDVIYDLGEMYREITMITGETPDANRDYALFTQIPDLEQRMTDCVNTLDALISDADALSEKGSSSNTSTLKNMKGVMERMLEYKYQAQIYKSSFYDNYSSISAWLYEVISMPLDLDNIYISSPDKEIETEAAGFFENLWFGVQRLAASMAGDYNSVSGTVDSENSISLWVNWGRDQVQVLNYLVQSEFTEKTGIGVDIKMTNATVIQGLLSGNGPDAYLHMSRAEPVNLAMRGALVNLEKFDDFEEVCERFMPTATVPYQYGEGTYALPDTQTFSVMFYRQDILEELGIEKVPETWEDFIAASSVIMRNKLQVGLPYTQITDMNLINNGLGALNIFPTLLMQSGGELYDEGLTSLQLTDEKSVETFKMWTDFYSKYGFPKTYDFYNRFRIGALPMAIQSYAQYTTISAAASEIRGLWGIAPIPGTEQEDGTINRSQAGAGSGCAIIYKGEGEENKAREERAWEFLKWWTSTDTQYRYSVNLESILGVVGRNMTSNIEALSMLSWNDDDFDILLEQWKTVNEMPEVPGGYYVPRVVDQAFWNVIENGKRVEEMLLEWDKVGDNEIEEKRSQYIEE